MSRFERSKRVTLPTMTRTPAHRPPVLIVRRCKGSRLTIAALKTFAGQSTTPIWGGAAFRVIAGAGAPV